MKNFAPEFETPEQYIIDITYAIWEERGVGRIREWYAADCPVRTPHGETHSVDDVVRHTVETMHEFPDRELLAEDVIIANRDDAFLSSHRVRSLGRHDGNGAFGTATGRPITMLAIADCLCRDNQVVEEWLLRDQASVALQLGLDPAAYGESLGRANPDAYTIGNQAMRQRWADPDGLVIVGEPTIANRVIDSYDAILNRHDLRVIDERYDRALRFEGLAGKLCYGRKQTANLFTGITASIPDGRFEPHHVVVRQQPDRATRVALRWSFCGTLSAYWRYGAPTDQPLALLGISHFELRDGLVQNEWFVIDETAVYAQIAAYRES
ncbi:MAG: ester cyclase [Chloroflexota bacterium]